MRNDNLDYINITAASIEEVCIKLRANKKVHMKFAGNGILHIDRQLPFLTIYRLSKNSADRDTEKLIKGEASYFIIPSTLPISQIALMTKSIVNELQNIFGAFLLLEIWTDTTLDKKYEVNDPITPIIEIHADTNGELISTCDRLRDALLKIKIHKKQAQLNINYYRKTRPSRKGPLLSKKALLDLNCYSIGVGLKPVYFNSETNELYPLVFRKYHAEFSHGLKHAFYEFSKSISKHRPRHYHALGARAITELTYKIDRQLAHLSSVVDFLLWVTPINTENSWKEFKKSKYEKVPTLYYNPVPIDPAKLKNQLFEIQIRKLNDPTIQALFEEKRSELDRQLTMLYERNTRNFRLSSMQLYGPVENSLYTMAQEILSGLSGRSKDDLFSGKKDAQDFAIIAKKEIEKLCSSKAVKFRPQVIITDQVSGLMVNNGNLYIGKTVRVPNGRVQALLQHEVGTHIVSFLNGINQPLKLFSFGLPGYDELQEGLAVLAEYLVGQLSKSRIKLLAGRVIAAKHMEEGADLKEIFNVLRNDFNFEEKTAYRIAIRIVRGGGLTKDSIYLRGFNNVIKYIQAGGDLKILFAGKFSQDQVPIVQELLYRGILKKPKIFPSYLDLPKTQKRLAYIQKDIPLNVILEG